MQHPTSRRTPSEALSRLVSVPFLGRETLLDGVRAHLARAAHGAGSGILLVGEPGIGKTRCADELVRSAGELALRVHRARCHQTGGAPALWPWVQLTRSLCDGLDEASLRRVLGPDLEALGVLLPAVAGRLGTVVEARGALDADDRFKLFEAVGQILKRAAREAPLLLVIDDLQWADPASVLLARFVLREISETPCALLALYRDTETLPDHPLAEPLADLAAESASFRLAGLTQQDVSEFVRYVAGFEVPAVLSSAIHAQTAGNPLFVLEVVRLLASENRLGTQDAPTFATTPLPSTVRHTLRRRLEALRPETRRVLERAAAIGSEFDREVIEHVDLVNREETSRALDEAHKARILLSVSEAGSRYRFVHDLIREVAYESLVGSERARVHRAIGESIALLRASDLPPHLAELAHHFLMAESTGSAAKAAGFAADAARHAAAGFSFEEATRLYEQALRAADLAGATTNGDDDGAIARLRCRARLGLGEVHWQTGERRLAREQHMTAVELARELGDAVLLARAAIGLSGLNDLPMDVPTGPAAPLEEALTILPREDSQIRVRVLSNLVRTRYFAEKRDTIDEWAREAVEIAERIAAPGTLFTALDSLHYARLVPEGLEERLAISARLPDLARRSGSARLAAFAHLWRAVDLLELPDLIGADAEIAGLDRLSKQLRQPFYRWIARGFRATRAQMSGRLSDAESLLTEAFRWGREAESPNAFIFFGTQLFHLREEQGRADELLGLMAKIVAESPALPVFRIGIPLIHALGDRREEARDSFEQVAAADFQDVPHDLHRIPMLTSAATVCGYLGDRRRAALLLRELSAHEGRVLVAGVATYWGGSIDRSLGQLEEVLGNLDTAIAHYEFAAEIALRAAANLIHAHTLCDLARALRSRAGASDAERASKIEEVAAGLYRRMGVEWRLARGGGMLAWSDAGPAGRGSTAMLVVEALSPNRFVERAGRWEILYAGRAIELTNSRGLAYIARLLESPEVDLHVLELAGADSENRTRLDFDAGLSISRGGDAGELIDPQAIKDYRRRLLEIAAERDECERTRDRSGLTALDEEVAFLERQITVARGRGGRSRRAASPVERARKAVSNRIRAALRRIRAEHPPLAHHLERSIRTGTHCAYRPEFETVWLRF